MRNEAFYSTAAQVLPTILIALAVEANLLLQRQWKRAEVAYQKAKSVWDAVEKHLAALDDDIEFVDDFDLTPEEMAEIYSAPRTPEDQAMYDSVGDFLFHRDSLKRQQRLAVAAAMIFILGEASALMVLAVGTSGYLPLILGPLVVLSLIALLMLVAWLPLLRLPSYEKDVPGLLKFASFRDFRTSMRDEEKRRRIWAERRARLG